MTNNLCKPSVDETAPILLCPSQSSVRHSAAAQSLINHVLVGIVNELFSRGVVDIAWQPGHVAQALGRLVLGAIEGTSAGSAVPVLTPEFPIAAYSPPSCPRVVLSFATFRLDLAEERLWKGDRELRLRREAPDAVTGHCDGILPAMLRGEEGEEGFFHLRPRRSAWNVARDRGCDERFGPVDLLVWC